MKIRFESTIRWLQLLILLYLFFISISLLSTSLKLFGEDTVSGLLSVVSNPFVDLFVGILATSIMQSSSSVTSITVGIMAGGGLDVAQAIPIIMGSNMGTSVTNALVAATQLNKPVEFQRAFAASVVNDFFEICCILVLFPLQLSFNILGTSASFFFDTVRSGRRLFYLQSPQSGYCACRETHHAFGG